MAQRTYQDIWNAFNTGPESEHQRYQDELKAVGTDAAAATSLLITSSVAINQGATEEAISTAQAAAEAFERCGDREFQARSVSIKAIAYFYSGSVADAYELWTRGWALIEHLDVPAQKGTFCINFGNVFSSTGDTEKAISYYRRGIGYFEDAGELDGQADCYTIIGSTLQDANRLEESIEPLTKAIDLNKQAGIANGGGLALLNLALSYALLNLIEESKAIFQQITEADRAHAIVNIGYEYCSGLYQELDGDLTQAVDTFERCEQLAREHAISEIQLIVLQRLRDCALKQNDLPRYVDFNQRFMELEKRVKGTEVSMRIATQVKEQEMTKERQEREKERALLYGALPESVATRMLRGESVSGDHVDAASVLFLDIAGFTDISDKIPPGHVVHLLEQIFTALDDVVDRHGVTKIKTIGDSYMAVAGVPEPLDDHAQRAADCALDMLATLTDLAITMPPELGDTSWVDDVGSLDVRIGLHCGPVTAGVIGTKRLQYDVWGDTVNTASRMESTGEPGRIQCSGSFARSFASAQDDVAQRHSEERSDEEPLFNFTERGEVSVKGKGTMTTYWLEGA